MKVALYFGDLSSANVGPAKYIRYLREYGHLYGFRLICFDRNGLYQGGLNNEEKNHRRKYDFVQSLILRYSKNTVVALLGLYLFYLRNGASVVRKYTSEESIYSSDNAIYVKDIFSLMFLYFFKVEAKSIVITLGNDGNALRMLYDRLPGLARIGRLISIYEAKAFSKATKILVLSENAKEVFSNNYGPVYNDKVEVLYNAIPDKLIQRKPTDEMTFVSVGTVCKRKGHDVLLRAFNMCLDEGYKIKLLLIGDVDPFFNEFLNDNPFLVEAEEINLCGPTSNVWQYLETSDCFVLASRDEGMPMSIIEALCADLPVIASNVAGIPEMLSHSAGFVFPNEDTMALKRIVSRLADEYEINKLSNLKGSSRSEYLRLFRFEGHLRRLDSFLTE